MNSKQMVDQTIPSILRRDFVGFGKTLHRVPELQRIPEMMSLASDEEIVAVFPLCSVALPW